MNESEHPEIKKRYKIYRLENADCLDKIYVGSTTNIDVRRSTHKSRCNNSNDPCYNTKIYRTIRENGGFCDWRLIMIKDMGLCTKLEARMEEDKMRLDLRASLNTRCAYLSPEQKKEQILIQSKQWATNNPERSNEIKKNWVLKNPAKRKEASKTYYEKNKQTILEKARKQREEKKKQEKLNLNE